MTSYEDPDDIRPIILYDTPYLAALVATIRAARSMPVAMTLSDPEEIARQQKKQIELQAASEMERIAKSVKPIIPPRQHPDYPMIKPAQIQKGDVVYLSHVSPKTPYLSGRYRVVKAKPIIGGRVQIKVRSNWSSSNKIQKINLDDTAYIELYERGGQSMDRNAT